MCVCQIKAHLKEAVSFSIEHVYNDYSVYENVCVNPDEFRHVIEIYNFPRLFKTDDLLDAFTEYRCDKESPRPSLLLFISIANIYIADFYKKTNSVCFSDGGMKIKWVDNTTALGVFSSESAGT